VWTAARFAKVLWLLKPSFYLANRAPRGLTETISPVWRKDGESIDTITLKIKGGRKQGYHSESKIQYLADAKGNWQVQVMTSSF
jgi:hypothetical protein